MPPRTLGLLVILALDLLVAPLAAAPPSGKIPLIGVLRPVAAADRLPTLADEWVRLPVDVLVTDGPGALAARQATDTIPIDVAVFANPLAEGLVGSPDSGLLVITPVLNTDS
jgi:hypothetical protein